MEKQQKTTETQYKILKIMGKKPINFRDSKHIYDYCVDIVKKTNKIGKLLLYREEVK